jgi:hypothetical protein
MRQGMRVPSCSFCGRTRPDGTIAGPGGNAICAGCVTLAAGVLSSGDPAATPAATLVPVPAGTAGGGCSFCGKRRERVRGIAAAGQVRICDECVDLCEEILADR